jgi:hypothetical protein
MPRGFDTESGGSLTAKQKEVAMRLLAFLKDHRESGYITPQNPITAPQISKLYNEKFGVRIADTLIRACVNHLRADLSHPIVSTNKGYFYAITKSEVEQGLLHMVDRRDALNDAIRGLEHSKVRMMV